MWPFSIFQKHRREKWRRWAQEQIDANRVATCVHCQKPIYPGQLIGIPSLPDGKGGFTDRDEDGKQLLIHAGFHTSLDEESGFYFIAATPSLSREGV